ncbi:MAG: adenosylcobinamide kinase [Ruminococcaceae bacterium]|nr:adenosylcobinamide kinase [Oscillospiraceae bacterium]
MKLILGGRNQGKLTLAKTEYALKPDEVCDGALCPLDRIPQTRAVNHLHLLIRRLMEAGKNPAEWVEQACLQNPEIIWITDEIGCGIVPVDPLEREWRETTGRICCNLAQRSDRVERVFCGIPTVLKG